jgi:integrase
VPTDRLPPARPWLVDKRFHDDEDIVFCHPHLGTHLDPSRLSRKYLRPALKTAGITRPFRPFHDLRHTSITYDAAAGNPLPTSNSKPGTRRQ